MQWYVRYCCVICTGLTGIPVAHILPGLQLAEGPGPPVTPNAPWETGGKLGLTSQKYRPRAATVLHYTNKAVDGKIYIDLSESEQSGSE